ncbi:unnamed protein product [Heterobilharzia americana]|nr:unnamed protein product [Heterobilharzia americana]
MKKNDRLNNNTMFPVSEVRAAIKQIKSSSKQSDGYISTHKSIGDVVPISDQNDFSSGCGADKGNLFPHHRDVNIAKSVDCTTNNGANNMKMISSTLSFNQSSDKWPVYKDHDEVKVYMRELRSPGSGLASKPSLESNNMTENQNTSDQIGYNGSTVESTFLLLSNRLTEKRLTANRPEALHLMTPKQIEAEKLALQKALLYFENLHGRPRERQDRITMRPLYNRYRSVKRLLNSLQTNQNPNFIEHMNEENSDTEGHLSVPSNDDVVRRKSIQSPPIFSMNSEVIPTKCILSTGNSTSSFKSNIPVSYSSLQHSRLNNHSSSVVFYDNGSNNKRIPPMSSSSSALLSVSSNLPLYSSNISPQFNLGDCNHELNNAYIDDDDDDDFEVTQKQSISSTIKSSHRSDVNKLCNQVDGLLLSTEKQNVNNFSAKRQSATNTRLDSNGGLSKVHSTSDYETKYTNSGNSRIQNNNEWFGTIGLSRQIQPGGDHDYFMTTSHLQYKYPSENNQRTIHESLSPSAGATTPMKSIKHPNTNDEYCPPSQQNNLIASKLSCVTLPTLSSSSLSNLKINQTNSSDLIRTNISAAVAKHRRRILTTSDNAINTISTVDDKYIESSQAMSSSSAAAGETNLANWSTSDLKAELRSLRESKRQLQKTLKDFEHEFIQATGQKVERADRLCMRSEYCQYKALKTRLLQLEAELKGRCA